MEASLQVLNQSYNSDVEFVPTIHALENVSDIHLLEQLPDSSKHLFTFNEPDGTKDSGGSGIDPAAAAQVYIDKIVPLRSRWEISHPSVTGSERGLAWLDSFNASCWAIDPAAGCPADFVVAHYYGDFVGLSWCVGQLASWYRITVDEGAGPANRDLKI
ncbi:Uu.00g037150.m01.CDS01 [Anthostomella pinea]|uniref:Uu.00g037150.m01.CDS01 n=1 Tax=Anthostomella pinea TaxID=933095 RepID=A0AAI8VA72_9PEZI|nr:Uu.00g037150.m01.CDS01 [Anthostomella pinea]